MWWMKILLVGFIYTLSFSLGMYYLMLPIEPCRNRKYIPAVIFCTMMPIGLASLYMEQVGLAVGYLLDSLVLIVFVILKWMTGISFSQIAVVICLHYLLAIGADTIGSFLFIYCQGYEVILPVIDAPGAMATILFSNSSQVLVPYIYAKLKIKYNKPDKKAVDGTTRLTGGIVCFQLAQFIGYLVFEKALSQNINMNFILLASQCSFIVVTLYLLYISWHDEEIIEMREQLDAFEKRNQAIYRYYQELQRKEYKLQRLRHDFNNFMMAACGMAEIGQTEKAAQLFANMERLLEEDEMEEEMIRETKEN